jgi:hypothetical protein
MIIIIFNYLCHVFVKKRFELLIHFPIDELLPVIDSHMMESVGDKTIITAEFIRVNETVMFHLFDRHLNQCFFGEISYYFNSYFSTAFQDTEYRDLPGNSPA